jgi:hypothetical protein
MIVKPSELPKPESVEIDEPLRKVTDWKLVNTDATPNPERSLSFIDSHVTAFFNSMRRAFKLIERPHEPLA